jgi:parallel beta-helix repeat protein
VAVRVARPDGSVVVGDGSQRPGSDRLLAGRAGRFVYAYRLAGIDGRYRVQVLGAGGRVLAHTTFMDAFGIQKLVLGSQSGPEDYQFAIGNTVWAQGSVDPADSTHPNRSYRFVFTSQSGTNKLTTACTANGPTAATVWGSYTIQANDPVSNAADWHVALKQYLDSACGSQEKTSSVAFDVAKATTYTTSSLATKQSFFPAGASAYVTVAGLKAGQSAWNTTWILPGGATACANTTGTDLPGSDPNGLLPIGTGSFLQYAPTTSGAAWNLQANYDPPSSCPAFSTANQGPWGLTLTLDATHFVSLSPFSVDTTAPTATATPPPYANASTITIPYTASDNPGGSGLYKVALYAKAPSASTYSLYTTAFSSNPTGSFTYTATKGDGPYSFYTIATDNVGNAQSTPSSANGTTQLDTAAPTSKASSAQYATSTTIPVSYTASDNSGGSGLAEVDLYVKGPSDSGYTKAASTTTPGPSGTLAYTATEGDGAYSFYTLATDQAGNTQPTPTGANTTTQLDTTPPASSASSPQYATTAALTISYTASDGGSGLAEVDLYAKGPTDTTYTKIAATTTPSSSGTFPYTATKGDGPYSFYTTATDKAGNTQPTPANPNTTTQLDTTPPTSTAQAPSTSTANSFTVSYTASDGGSGLAEVDLYAKGPTDTTYTKVASTTTPSASASFNYTAGEGNGNYGFYTIATDKAGNAEVAPSTPDATTALSAPVPDTTPPTSQASSPQYSNSAGFTVSYTAADNPGGSGVATVDLYAKGPTDSAYTKVASATSPSGSGSFNFTATEGDGPYSFYTIATDQAGNIQPTPANPTTTQLDTNAPSSQASSPQRANSTTLAVPYTAADNPGGSGLAEVDLYAKGPGDSTSTKVASTTTPSATGSLSYTATEGDGTYSFYTIATDKAGNIQPTPASPTTTQLDTTPPTSQATLPQYTNSSSITVSYTASDIGSGLAKVDLYAKGPADSGYAQVATAGSPTGSGSFNFAATEGDGSYSFYTIATDQAGNTQAAPAGPNATTRLDTTAPTSKASSSQYANSRSFAVAYTASDAGSGLAEVDLYTKGPSDAGYTKVAASTSPSGAGSFGYTATEGDGSYSFYTIATDQAGNVQPTPAGPDSSTQLATSPPASQASSPQLANTISFTVSYTASAGSAGLAKVDLYAKGPNDTGYANVASDPAPGSSGSFNFTASEGDGSYSFYSIATDQAGNVQSNPASPNTTTQLDTTAPTSQASSPQYAKSPNLSVSYTAADGGTGVAAVDLYALGPADRGYTKVASSNAASGSFNYTASEGDGPYRFYTVATDQAGNVQAPPASPNATTQLDTAPPTSKAASPQTSTSPSLTVSYTASDNSGGSGLSEVDLYAQGPSDSSYAKVASATTPGASGAFTYSATEGNGSYSFYTIAIDTAGNVQAAPTTPDSTTAVNTAAPTSQATSPQTANSSTFTVSYSASAGTGLASVDLYVKGPADSGYAKAATNASPSGSGSFSYTATEGDGRYSFYTIATDTAGNVQATPVAPNTTTLLDTTAPASQASSPQTSNSGTFMVSYSASDGGSGLAEVDLYAKGPADASYSKVAGTTAPSGSGSFSYTASEGDGSYSFYTIASDQAGNVQAAPPGPNATTQLDTAAPASQATSPQYARSSSFTVSYTAADNAGGSGLAGVVLYVKGPSDTAYTKAATTSSPAGSGSFNFIATEGDGSYSFYTVATDQAGNTESAPINPDSTTVVDTSAPTSQATSPQYANSSTITVSYTASDGGSGLAEVDLYAKGPADASYTKVAASTSPSSSGSFSFAASESDGIYSFYTIATDRVGNVQATPASSGTTVTHLDTTAPSSQASSPLYATSATFTVGYTAADEAGGTGLAHVDLYAEGPTDNSYVKVASISSPAGSGSFSYTAGEGEGPYHFYTIATDNAGNVEATPDAGDPTTPGDTTTRYDATPPTSQASSPQYANTAALTVNYTASDTNSGLAEVDLYAKGPSDSVYAKVARDTSPAPSGNSFSYNGTEGNGTYSFYTIAIDQAGNAQPTPTAPQTTTQVNPNLGNTDVVDELHYTFTGPTSVAFDWRGSATDIRYGTTTSYGSTATASPASPSPFSSAGPFEQVQLTGLAAGTTYHYSVGGGVDHTFSTPPTGSYTFDVEGDIGSSSSYRTVAPTQSDIAAENPAFVLTTGNLTYGSPFGQSVVDQAFNDIMPWSTTAADMPAWGTREWSDTANDDLRNYKGRFMLPNPQTSPSAPSQGCCGQDWSWFDAGGVRFISYPEPYTTTTWSDWQQAADAIFASAQSDPSIRYIVTFGHQPAYSTGQTPGNPTLAGILNGFGDKYSKYVLNVDSGAGDYERFVPIHGVTNITSGGGGASLENPWSSTDANTAFRALHLEHLRIDVSPGGMRVSAICGPATNNDDTTCVEGSVLDTYAIGTNAPAPPPPPHPTIYVDHSNPSCSDTGTGTQTQPFCSLKPAASTALAGQTVQIGNGTYKEQLTPVYSGTASAPITFAAAPGTTPTITGVANGVWVQNVNYITIQGLTVTGTSSEGIVVKNASNITLRGNHVSYSGQPAQGLVANGIRADAVSGSIIAANTVDHNTDYGIYLFDGSTGNQVTGNRVFSNARVYERAASGIRLFGATNNTVASNYSYDNEDSGLEFFDYAGSNIVRDNVSYNNGDHGIDDNNAPCQTIVSDTVYNNFTAGINLEADSPGGIVENNISVDNGLNSTRTKSNIRVDSQSIASGTCVNGTAVSGATVDYNLVNLSASGFMYVWGTNLYTSLSAFQAATGQESHGIQADPKWVNPSAGDFHLQGISPAIDSANSGAPSQPLYDFAGNPRVDDAAVPNTGAGPRAYDDRGALELQPQPPPATPPTAALNVTPNSGTAPFQVTADASGSTSGTNPIVSYTFDFGDGSPEVGPQTSPTATHVYSQPGIRTVKVTVTDSGGLASSTTQQVLVRDAPPTASLSVSPSFGPAPLQVSADASASTDGDATPIATYSFDFGDGSATVGPQAGATAGHSYTAAGTYTVTLTVTDTAGNSSTTTTQVTVSSSPLGDAPPTAGLAVNPNSGTAPLHVSADASGSTDTDTTPVATYTFNFGDGSAAVGPQAGATVSHTYAAAGTYTVTVTVIDTAGNSSAATQQVTVTPVHQPPTAVLNVNLGTGLTPMAVTADASGSADSDGTAIASYTFDFGDGSAAVGPQAGATATHSYATAGTYTVTVTVTDALGYSSTATRQVTAYTNLVGNSGFESGKSGWNTSGGSSGITLTLVAGGHSGSYAAQLSNTNSTPATCMLNDSPNWVAKTTAGQYTGTLWVRADAAGGTLNLRFREYSGSTLLGTKTTSVKLTTSWQQVVATLPVITPGSTFDYNAYETGAQPGTCFYADDATIYNGSSLEYAPNASVTVTPASGLAPLQVTADASVSSDTDSTPISTYTFDFGDGTPVVGPQPGATATHTYTAPGAHTVKVTVTDSAGNSSTTTTEVVVGDAPPSAALTVSPTSGTTPVQVTADASASSDPDSTGTASYTFDFGDGSPVVGPQTNPTATHLYTSLGTHTVTVTVTDSSGNASSATKHVVVNDAPPAAILDVTPGSGAAPLQVTADASGSSDTDSTPIASFTFNFGDGSAAVGPQTGATASHTYTTAGTYTVTLTATDTAGNSSSTTTQVTVSPPPDQPPTALLSVTPNSGSAPLQVTADASASTDTDSTPIADYRFNFGDGSAAIAPQTGATATHTYPAAGTYTVTMTATDTAGNSSTATTQVTVSATQPPNAMLSVTPSSGTAPLQVWADASATTPGSSPIATYSFNFGDGSTVVGPQPGAATTHIYDSPGTYTVTMMATDTAGNSSTATTQVTVDTRPDAPPAGALALAPASGTAPLQVSADASGSTDTDSTPIASYTFNFGDGSAAVGPQTGASASHTYNSAGTYTVTVTVTDTAGNASTATQQVTVSAPDLPPAPALTVTPAAGFTPLAVTADASGSTDTDASPVAKYKFDFGDGSPVVGPQTGATATHTYTTAGTYAVTTTVTDTVGNASTITEQITAYANQVGNPGFEANTNGWNTSGSGSGTTLTQVSGGHSGSFAAKLANTSTGNSTCTLNDSPNWVAKTSSGQYTGGLWVRADTAGATLNLRLREYSSTASTATLLGTKTATIKLSTAWQQVTVTLPIATPGSTVDYNAYVASAAPGTCFYADDATLYNG